jgi:hypothetical protein
MKSISSGEVINCPHLGSSVASLALWTPITAASAISGWVSRTFSNSAGGTDGNYAKSGITFGRNCWTFYLEIPR